MENAIKAVYIGAATLIAVLVLGVFVYMFRSGARFGEAYEDRKSLEQLQAFNSQFEVYANESNQYTSQSMGYSFKSKGNIVSDVISCANLVLDINEKYDYDPQNSIEMIVKTNTGTYYIYPNDTQEKNKFSGGDSSYRDFYNFLKYYSNVRIVDISQSGYKSTNESIYEYYFDVDAEGIIYSDVTGKVTSITFEIYKTKQFDNTEVWYDSV